MKNTYVSIRKPLIERNHGAGSQAPFGMAAIKWLPSSPTVKTAAGRQCSSARPGDPRQKSLSEWRLSVLDIPFSNAVQRRKDPKIGTARDLVLEIGNTCGANLVRLDDPEI
jgi:hypothetical protein